MCILCASDAGVTGDLPRRLHVPRLFPANHAPDFAPVIHPTLETCIETMLAASSAWLTGEGSVT